MIFEKNKFREPKWLKKFDKKIKTRDNLLCGFDLSITKEGDCTIALRSISEFYIPSWEVWHKYFSTLSEAIHYVQQFSDVIQARDTEQILLFMRKTFEEQNEKQKR